MDPAILTVAELKELLRECGGYTSGTKAVLVGRVRELVDSRGCTLGDLVARFMEEERAMEIMQRTCRLREGSNGGEVFVDAEVTDEMGETEGGADGEERGRGGELTAERADEEVTETQGAAISNISDHLQPGDSASQVSGRSSKVCSVLSMTERRTLLRARVAAARVEEAGNCEIERLEEERMTIEAEAKRKKAEMERRKLAAERRVKNAMMEAELAVLEEGEEVDLQEIRQRQSSNCTEKFRCVEKVPKSKSAWPTPSLDTRTQIRHGVEIDGIWYEGKNVGKDSRGSTRATGVQLKTKDTFSSDKGRDLLQTFIECSLKSQLPKQELEKFEGDIAKFRIFRQAFGSQIESKLVSSEEKLHYLYQYTCGRPRKFVEACLNMHPDEGYEVAWGILEKKYGNMEQIATEFVDRLLGRDQINRDDVSALEEYHVELLMAKHAISDVSYGKAELENPKTLRLLVDKLPYQLQEKWRYLAAGLSDKGERTASFDDLVKMVDQAARAANHPLYGKRVSSLASGMRERPSKGRLGQKVTCGVVREVHCLHCSSNHDLLECQNFRDLHREEKLQHLRQYGVCFMCFKLGHVAKACPSPLKCEKCARWHPVAMHMDREARRDYDGTSRITRGSMAVGMSSNSNDRSLNRRDPSQSGLRSNAQPFQPRAPGFAPVVTTSVFAASASAGVIGGSMAVVPVIVVGHCGEGVSTGAFMDSGSAVSFCTRRLVRFLGVESGVKETDITVSTMTGDGKVKCGLVFGLSVRGIQKNGSMVALPPLYVVEDIPISKSDVISRAEIDKWEHLRELELAEVPDNIDLMLGANAAAASEPLEIRSASKAGDPYALRTRLGWVVCGESRLVVGCTRVGRVNVKDRELNSLVERAFDRDLDDLGDVREAASAEDHEWLRIVEAGCRLVNGRYEVPLPLRKREVMLPDSRKMAETRIMGLRAKLLKDSELKLQYVEFMNKMLMEGYAEEACDSSGPKWYVPHFGVRHPCKPGKVRIVFDCAAKVRGMSLNDLLLQGPDMNSKLVDVLLRFRQGEWAYTADIDSMFYQVKVPAKDRDFLRFLWWSNESLNGELKEFRMTVHLFGACSSPSVAMYALKRTTLDNTDYGRAAKVTVMNNFYVDDCLKAGTSEDELVSNSEEVVGLCSKGGFTLNKFVSLSNKLLVRRGVGETKEDDKKALGVIWDLHGDYLKVNYSSDKMPFSRRQLLSLVAGIYDPLGIVAPMCLKGRHFIQCSFKEGRGWDEHFDESTKSDVGRWMKGLTGISGEFVPRNIFGGGKNNCWELHVFADASQFGHGVVAYAVAENDGHRVCTFLWGKARVNPLKELSIPRLELIAASLGAKMKRRLEDTLENKPEAVHMWTDSMTVLHYLRNRKDRFSVFVANRVSLIKERTRVEDWKYVTSEWNPADDASRGVQTQRWKAGPEFIMNGKWPREPEAGKGDLEFRELKVMQVNTSQVNALDKLVAYFSDWVKLKRAIAWWLRFQRILKAKLKGDQRRAGELTVWEIEGAEKIVLLHVQRKQFVEELKKLTVGQQVRKTSSLAGLGAFLGADGLLRARGRLTRVYGRTEVDAPVILPSRSAVTALIIRSCHSRLGHLGSTTILGNLRDRYWIIRGHATVRRVVRNCVICRKVQGRPATQMMADLPEDRLISNQPAFASTGLDCFGPFYVKRFRKSEKRYGLIFCCMASRAVHLEVLHDLSTDATINAIRRFKARRGNVRKLRCDHGTNFIGTKRELTTAWREIPIEKRLASEEIEWDFNPPKGSHFGGVWERLIRTVRRVLESILGNRTLNEDMLHTLFCEVEAIVNSRPLNVVSSDVKDVEVITPNRLLNLNGGIVGCCKMDEYESYSRRRWRQVQQLAENFWKGWCKLYRNSLLERQKWVRKQRNVRVGDIVLLVDESEARCHWPLGRVVEVFVSDDGLVRSVQVLAKGKSYLRPIAKLVVLLREEDLY